MLAAFYLRTRFVKIRMITWLIIFVVHVDGESHPMEKMTVTRRIVAPLTICTSVRRKE